MPDSPSTFDDPFADLFGRLPEPRRRSGESDSSAGGATPPPSGQVPLSRRAAREAASQTAPVASPPEVSVREVAVPEAPAQTAAPAPEPTPTTASVSTPRLDDLFAGRASADDFGSPPPPRQKRRHRAGGWIALGIVLLVLGGIAAGSWYVWTTYEDKIREVMGWEEPKDYDEGLAEGEALVTIVSGDTGQSISQSLFDAGVTKTPDAFYDYLVDTSQNPPFVPGVFQLQQKMTSEAALEALMDPENKLENSVLLREGLTVDQTIQILSESLGLPLEDFEAAVADPTAYGVTVDPAIAAAGGQPLEGWLFPAMYTFDPGVTAEDAIGTLVNRTKTSLGDAGVPEADQHRVLTIASIIQREARFEQDFYNVSRVIENRLDPSNQETFGLLQMDSTAKYGVGEDESGSLDVSTHAQTDDNPWNTYLHPGLPIGPIANAGDLAIDAAMHPSDGPWLYFVTVDPESGETVFTSTYAEHLRYVEVWKSWCRANPDYPC